jgi:hypothetical protein
MNEGAGARVGSGPSRRLARWAAGLSLLPIPIWFVVGALLAPRPAWRAEYRSGPEPASEAGEASVEASEASKAAVTGTSAVSARVSSVVAERELQHYWDKGNPSVPGGVDVRASFSARYETCLSFDAARQVPLMLVSDGTASLEIDGVERLRIDTRKRRVTRGEVLDFQPGTHRLSVNFAARGWSSVALLASFDGRAPRAVGSGSLARGVVARPPAGGADPCAAR